MNVFLSIRVTSCMILALVYMLLHWDSKPIHLALQDVAICLAGIVGSCASLLFAYYRKRTSKLMIIINEISVAFLKRNDNVLENRRASNKVFISMCVFCGVLQMMASMTFVMFAWEFAKSGLPNFNSFFYQPTPYSFMAYFDGILFLVPGVWVTHVVTFYSSMYIEFILRISLHFRVLADDMRKLRRGVDTDEEEELQKLKSLIKDLNFYYW